MAGAGRRCLGRWVAAAAPLLLAAACGRPARPNLVLIVLDTARADRLSHAGYPRATTPFLDALARDAVRWAGAHSVSPWTLPSHASMFTGLLPGRHGATWEAFAEPAEMTLNEILSRALVASDPGRLLAVRLRARGYTTLGFSNNAWVGSRTGLAEGFDVFAEVWREDPPPLAVAPDLSRRELARERALAAGDAGRVLRAFFARAESGLPEPFFLFFNFIDPHFPYAPPPPWRYAFSDDRELGERIAAFEFDELSMVAGERPIALERLAPFYDAEIRYLDTAMGRLLGWLRERGLYDDALVIVTSDHGEHLGEGGRFSHQFSVEEELLRVPLLVKHPGNRGAGRVERDPLASNLDVYATLLAAAGAEAADPATASRDLAGPRRPERRFLIAEYYYAPPFLRAHEASFAGFSSEQQAVTRRVVYEGAGRSVFVERDGAQELVAAQGHADPAAPGRAAAVLRDYVRDRGEPLFHPRAQPLDDATRERLRSLGYAD